MCLLLPFPRALLGLIFYIAIRGWFFPRATIQQTSFFGFVAISAWWACSLSTGCDRTSGCS
ncbi:MULTISPECIES: hypothetical protein [Methanosarcina]|nr:MULTISPECIES: hypothetical protein [Methanosarcina]